jgi:four helix bundle protein
MATFNNFEDIIAWQKARELCKRIKPILDKIGEQRDFELKNQMAASSGSVMDNIAEGFERQGNKEFVYFLYISKGSCGELRSQLYRAFDQRHISQQEFDELLLFVLEISRILNGLIQSIAGSDLKGHKYK